MSLLYLSFSGTRAIYMSMYDPPPFFFPYTQQMQTYVSHPPPPAKPNKISSTLGPLQVFGLVQPSPLRREICHPGPQQAPLSRHVIQCREDVGRPEEDRHDPVSLCPRHPSTGVCVGIDVGSIRGLAVR